MARLRDPAWGCPWDREQTFESIAPYTIEEAYEVADAIERHALAELAEELGDLLLQVVYHARLAEERGAFTFTDVTRHICEKMIRRHPHVFGTGEVKDGGSPAAWEALKRQEKAADGGVLDGVALALPALTRAVKLGRRASRVGFDWPDAAGPREKVDEELAELDAALADGDPKRVSAEAGDVFFALANLCRHAGIDPEQCARDANRRFESRFRQVEAQVRLSGRGFDRHSLEELEAYWQQAKRDEASSATGAERS